MKLVPCRAGALASAVPDFLAPCLANAPRLHLSQPRYFSTTPAPFYPRDMNRERGVSPLRRTGLRQPLSVSKEPLPKPLLDAEQRTKIKVDDDHPLWQFFDNEKNGLTKPIDHAAHGRQWTTEECRHKSWEDLQRLWWVCVKERNRLATAKLEFKRLNAGEGLEELDERDRTVKSTMKSIMHALTERWYAWEEARQMSMDDPSVDLSGDGPAYEPAQEQDEWMQQRKATES